MRTSMRPFARTFAAKAGDVKVKLPESSFETYKLDSAPAMEVSLSKDRILHMYHEMNVVRRMEMAADALYKAKQIFGFCHLSVGQEAIAIGIEEAADKKDTIITSYRCHGFEYTRGGKIEAILAELMGRSTGVSKGKGGSMHMYTKTFFGGNGIVGAQVPLGLGLSFAHQYKGEPNLTIALYGDGAANQGQVFESYNMAKLWDVPVIFACENNKYGMGTSDKRSSAMTEYYKRGQYIPGLKINAMDVFAVYSGTKFAREWSLKNGPIVVEYETYRYGGHSMSDPGTTYRTREEVQKIRNSRDPLNALRAQILEFGLASDEELTKIEKDVRQMVNAEVEKAKAAPRPEPTMRNLFEDTYIPGSSPAYARGRLADEIYEFEQ